jgi:hypothetical protein
MRAQTIYHTSYAQSKKVLFSGLETTKSGQKWAYGHKILKN